MARVALVTGVERTCLRLMMQSRLTLARISLERDACRSAHSLSFGSSWRIRQA